MADDCRSHRSQCQYSPSPADARSQQQNGSDQFPDSLAVAPPGFEAHFAEDVNRFGSSSEFEEQRLEHDRRRDDPAYPTRDHRRFGYRNIRLRRQAPRIYGGAPGRHLEIIELWYISSVFHWMGMRWVESIWRVAGERPLPSTDYISPQPPGDRADERRVLA